MFDPLNLFGYENALDAKDKIVRKGQRLLEETFEEQKSYGRKLQEKFPDLTNEYMLTTALPFRDDIPQKYRERIQEYRKRVNEILFRIAAEIQDQKFAKNDREIRKAGFTSKFQETRCIQMIDAQKELYASYDAIRESLNYITQFNKYLLQRINESQGPQKTDLLLLNALIVHELTDAIIQLIKDFQLRGKQTLRNINDQILEELRTQHATDEQLWNRSAKTQGQVGEMVRKAVKERAKIRGIVVKKWDKIWEQVGELENNISNARGFLPNLRLIRDNARAQINMLEVIGITQIVDSNVKNFQEICEVTNVELAPLTKEDVYGLIGRVDEAEES
jgi:hypothetical protein